MENPINILDILQFAIFDAIGRLLVGLYEIGP